jgi:FkbM family methyltransferase
MNQIKCDDADYLLFATDDLISNTLYRTGKWDHSILTVSKFLYDKLSAPLILDVGANLGAYAIPLAKDIQSKGGVVCAFEPQRIVYYQLCGNAVLNRLDNLFTFNQAVGDYVGEIEIPDTNYETNRNVGAFSLSKEYRETQGVEASMLATKTVVSMVTLDAMPLDKAPAIVKIDVEGFEINVFKGGVKFLEEHNYPPVLFEVWPFEWFKKEKLELFAFVQSLGYRIDAISVSDFLAQHPKNAVQLDFVHRPDGNVDLVRLR